MDTFLPRSPGSTSDEGLLLTVHPPFRPSKLFLRHIVHCFAEKVLGRFEALAEIASVGLMLKAVLLSKFCYN